MASLPQDPYMLLSVINMKLRDRFSSLDGLCEDMDANRKEIESVLAAIDYHYDPEQNAFV
jgi:hypothetical protein